MTVERLTEIPVVFYRTSSGAEPVLENLYIDGVGGVTAVVGPQFILQESHAVERLRR